jgi:hypothetical protein
MVKIGIGDNLKTAVFRGAQLDKGGMNSCNDGV